MHNPQGVLRFIEVGEGISESIVQGNNNLSNPNDESIHKSKAEEHESEAEEQQEDHNPLSNNTGPIMTMSYGRVSRAQHDELKKWVNCSWLPNEIIILLCKNFVMK